MAVSGATFAGTGQGSSLFAEADKPSYDWDPPAIIDRWSEFRSRTTTIDLGELAVANVRADQPIRPRLRLNLFHDVDYQGIVERVRPTLTGYALSGRVADLTGGSFTIVVNGDVVAGDVRGREGAYRLYGHDGTVRIEQIDPDPLTECKGGLVQSHEDASPIHPSVFAPRSPTLRGKAAQVTDDDGSDVDVFVFYTSTIRRIAGGHEQVRAIVDLNAAWTNEAYIASGVTQQINLVGVAEIADIPAAEGQDLLHWLTYRAPDVQAIRDAYAADLVALVPWRSGGLAWISVLNSRPEHLGYSLFGLYSPDAFAHELGHNMGLRHPRNGLNPDLENTPYPYSHGYVLPGLPRHDFDAGHGNFTIMDGAGGPGLQRFSSPDLEYKGIPLGVPGDQPSPHADGPADAVRSLNNTHGDIASFRSSATRCEFRLTPESANVAASGGSFTIGVQTDNSCRWSVRSHEPAVVIESGEAGEGDGEVTYRVTPNEGWERTVALRIAGETFLVRQASDRVPTPVCERSEAIRAAIAASLEKSCDNIDTPDLNRIARLDVMAGMTPAAGDFDGLTNLGELRLVWSGSARLPASIFDGLVNVVELQLTGAGLEAGVLDAMQNLQVLRLIGGESLASDLFEELADLERLSLVDHDLSSLSFGSFQGLESVKTLRIQDSSIGVIERGAFDGLDQLTKLEVIENEIESIRSGAFEGLDNLRTLQLYTNKLTRLVAGTFDGLSQVEWLNLQSNEISELERESFRGLSSLLYLYLSRNRLESLPDGIFSDLTTLKWRLELSENQLESLAPGTFAALENLLALELGQNHLRDLAPAAFDGLANLIVLDLHDNQLDELPAGLFAPTPELGELRMHANELTRLPDAILDGLPRLTALTLRDNPGAPFAFSLDLVRAPRPETGIESVALQVSQGAPFPMSAPITVQDGKAGVGEASIAAGRTRGSGIAIEPIGDGVVTVAVTNVPENPTVQGCERANRGNYRNLKPCYPGVKLVAGEPIYLFGIPDRTIANERSAMVKLNDVFGVFFDADDLFFEATSSDSAIVETNVDNGTLNLTRVGMGTAIVTVKATDGQSTVTRQFQVTVDALAPGIRDVYLFPSASQASGLGVVRVINHSARAGEVGIVAIDDSGRRFSGATLALGAGETVHFNSEDLENGNSTKGLSGGIGATEGDLRLELTSELVIEVLTYIRTADGFLTSMLDAAPSDGNLSRVATLNPASNLNQVGVIRLINPGDAEARVSIMGIDDAGHAGESVVSLSVPAGAGQTISAEELESGTAQLSGSLGDGAGKWQLTVSSDRPLIVMSLLRSPTGHLTNLSSAPFRGVGESPP